LVREEDINMGQIEISWLSRHRKAQTAADPNHPNGRDIDGGQRPACKVELQYPAECVGLYYVECLDCKSNMLITTAGRPDDPKTVMLPCRQLGPML
jgi:hypothetical protein